MEMRNRLEMLINVLGIKRSDFARAINVTQGNVSDWINDKKPSKPSSTALARISEEYNVNLNWLITGKGDMFLPPEDGSLVTNGTKARLEEMSGNGTVNRFKLSPFEVRTITLPLMGEIAAGEPVENNGGDGWDYIEIPKAFLNDRYDSYCVLRVNGHSMEPRINHGDIVVIHQRSDWDNLDRKVCAVRTADGITLKKVQFSPEKRQVILKPYNPDYETLVLDETEWNRFQIIGEMAMQFRVFRTGSQNEYSAF